MFKCGVLNKGTDNSRWTEVLFCKIEMDTAGKCPKKKVSLPQGRVTKNIKEMLPPNVQVAKDAQGLFKECCDEFINMLSSESSEISIKEGRKGPKIKVVTPKHVLRALEVLGFEEYIGEVQAAYEQYRSEMLKKKETREGAVGEGMTQEEALAAQQKLFAEARARMNHSSGVTVPATQATNSDDEEDADQATDSD